MPDLEGAEPRRSTRSPATGRRDRQDAGIVGEQAKMRRRACRGGLDRAPAALPPRSATPALGARDSDSKRSPTMRIASSRRLGHAELGRGGGVLEIRHLLTGGGVEARPALAGRRRIPIHKLRYSHVERFVAKRAGIGIREHGDKRFRKDRTSATKSTPASGLPHEFQRRSTRHRALLVGTPALRRRKRDLAQLLALVLSSPSPPHFNGRRWA